MRPAEPNMPYAGGYPVEIEEMRTENPVLVDEIGKLPEVLDGISKKEAEALRELAAFYQQKTASFNKAFNRMMKVGLPEKRRYNSPLQALFWIAYDDMFELEEVPLEDFNLELLLYKAWWFGDERWRDFAEVRERLNSPVLLDFYERRVIKYKYVKGHWEGVAETSYVFVTKHGHCAMITRFTRDILNYNGYSASKMLVDEISLTSTNGYRHRATLFEANDRTYVMDNGRTRPYGIVRREDYNPLSRPVDLGYAWSDFY